MTRFEKKLMTLLKEIQDSDIRSRPIQYEPITVERIWQYLKFKEREENANNRPA